MTARVRVGAAAAALGVLLALVGGIALVASYWHARALAHAYRSPNDIVPDLSAWLPLTTDGLLAGAFAVIYWRRLADQTVPRLAWAGAGLAGVATLAANLATAHPSVTGWIIAGWAPVTFTFVDFLVAILIPPLVKAWRDTRDDTPWPHLDPTHVMPSPDIPRTQFAGDVRDRLPDDVDATTLEDPAGRIVATVTSRAVSTLRPRGTVDDPIPATDDEAVQRLQAEIDNGADLPKARHLRDRWGFNSVKAKRIIDRLRERAS